MKIVADSPIMALISKWASSLGYYDGKIDLSADDLSSFAAPAATLTAHAPLWGTKEGAEQPLEIAAVRAQLSRILKVTRVARHDMHAAVHPDGDAVGLFFVVKFRIAMIPITVRTVPLLFVVHAVETPNGLRINELNEWSAADPEAARRILVDQYGWPTDTAMQPHVAFGASS